MARIHCPAKSQKPAGVQLVVPRARLCRTSACWRQAAAPSRCHGRPPLPRGRCGRGSGRRSWGTAAALGCAAPAATPPHPALLAEGPTGDPAPASCLAQVRPPAARPGLGSHLRMPADQCKQGTVPWKASTRRMQQVWHRIWRRDLVAVSPDRKMLWCSSAGSGRRSAQQKLMTPALYCMDARRPCRSAPYRFASPSSSGYEAGRSLRAGRATAPHRPWYAHEQRQHLHTRVLSRCEGPVDVPTR